MRCCIATIHEHEGPDDEGTTLHCKWCNEEIEVKDGVWRWKWNRP